MKGERFPCQRLGKTTAVHPVPLPAMRWIGYQSGSVDCSDAVEGYFPGGS